MTALFATVCLLALLLVSVSIIVVALVCAIDALINTLHVYQFRPGLRREEAKLFVRYVSRSAFEELVEWLHYRFAGGPVPEDVERYWMGVYVQQLYDLRYRWRP